MSKKETDKVNIFVRMFTLRGKFLQSFYLNSHIHDVNEIYSSLSKHPDVEGLLEKKRFTKFELTYKSPRNNKIYKIDLPNKGKV